jgi:hypothetical protein
MSAAGLSLVKVSAQDEQLQTTPACDDGDEPTPPQTKGPFYTPDTPERTSFLEEGIVGTRLVVVGKVLGIDCQPIAGALLDFWHADDAGQYDNAGISLVMKRASFSSRLSCLDFTLGAPATFTSRCKNLTETSSRVSSIFQTNRVTRETAFSTLPSSWGSVIMLTTGRAHSLISC